ncbi:hypothetical protein HanHA300_Chr13g0475381 [Helianthus annuus]|nr:hypothetical protein HanHA300_Chr13g0475381 [Helianthus annuus]KAJ0497070.1 hypothetical protein HanHA89_Chr13g0507301 [Helianthus annuus]KAJ0670594.1 hypothetical protein HanOQP8_Chr13g0476281 [Helianthus annuus]
MELGKLVLGKYAAQIHKPAVEKGCSRYATPTQKYRSATRRWSLPAKAIVGSVAGRDRPNLLNFCLVFVVWQWNLYIRAIMSSKLTFGMVLV